MPAIDTTTVPEGALQTHEYVSLVGWGAIAVALVILSVSLFVSLARAPMDANVPFEPYSYYGGHGVAYE